MFLQITSYCYFLVVVTDSTSWHLCEVALRLILMKNANLGDHCWYTIYLSFSSFRLRNSGKYKILDDIQYFDVLGFCNFNIAYCLVNEFYLNCSKSCDNSG